MSIDTLVGIPFRDKGRDREGCDCWGLVRLAFREIRNIDLPSYDDGYAGIADKAEIHRLFESGKAAWLPVPHGTEQPFDVLLMTLAGTDHVGLVVRYGLMLHMPPRAASVIEPYTSLRYARRAERGSFHRYVPA